MASTINDLRDSMKFVREEIQKLKREKAGSGAPANTGAQKTNKFSGKPKEDARYKKKETRNKIIDSQQQKKKGNVIRREAQPQCEYKQPSS